MAGVAAAAAVVAVAAAVGADQGALHSSTVRPVFHSHGSLHSGFIYLIATKRHKKAQKSGIFVQVGGYGFA